MCTQADYWEKVYSEGRQMNRAPFDHVVSFLYYNAPRNTPRNETNILELGCGAGNNLWFAAREGFSVTGIDISQSAIQYAKNRFKEDSLKGEFIVGDFMSVANLDKKFDLVIDRGALCYITFQDAKNVIHSLSQVMKPNSKMLFCPLSDKHSLCASGTYADNGMTINMSAKQGEVIHFYNRRDIYELFKEGFSIESLTHVEKTEMLNENYALFAEWVVVAKNVR